MQFWKFQTCPNTWKIGMHFSFIIPVTMQFHKFCRPAPKYWYDVLPKRCHVPSDNVGISKHDYECQMLIWLKSFMSQKFSNNTELMKKVSLNNAFPFHIEVSEQCSVRHCTVILFWWIVTMTWLVWQWSPLKQVTTGISGCRMTPQAMGTGYTHHFCKWNWCVNLFLERGGSFIWTAHFGTAVT